MSDKNITLNIEISNLNSVQARAIEALLHEWQRLGELGSSSWTHFFAPGNWSFHPKILVDGHLTRTVPGQRLAAWGSDLPSAGHEFTIDEEWVILDEAPVEVPNTTTPDKIPWHRRLFPSETL